MITRNPEQSQLISSNFARPRRLLIMEDKVNISQVLAAFCATEHYELTSVSTGLECMNLFLSELPDLVIVEAKLSDSIVATMMNWRNDLKKYIPIIMVGQEPDRPLSQVLGMDDFIVQPVKPAELMARLEVTLQRQEAPVSSVAASQSAYAR